MNTANVHAGRLERRVRRVGSVRMPTRQRSQKPETTHTPETLWKAGTCGHAKPALRQAQDRLAPRPRDNGEPEQSTEPLTSSQT